MNLAKCPIKNEFSRAGRNGRWQTEKSSLPNGKRLVIQCLLPVWGVYLPSPSTEANTGVPGVRYGIKGSTVLESSESQKSCE